MALRKIFLTGKLGKLFGEKWELDVQSVSEAIRAINANTKGKFFEYLRTDGAKKYYKIGLGKKENLIEPLVEANGVSGKTDIYIMPTIKGSSAVGKIIAGIVLIVVGIVAMAYGQTWGAQLVKLGAGLVLGGIVQLLTPVPPSNQTSESDGRGSNIFAGNANTVTQGSAVGVIYGRVLVSPMPISLSVDNVDKNYTSEYYASDTDEEYQDVE